MFIKYSPFEKCLGLLPIFFCWVVYLVLRAVCVFVHMDAHVFLCSIFFFSYIY